ncbi:phosphopantetheine-binding protein, partial [Motilimonas pumila]
YMIPSVFVLLEQLPLTPNGKIDRKALPEPDMSAQQVEYVAPRSETEKVLCEIWQEVLGVERVGVTDNFFQLGGHSLLVVKLVTLVDETFDVPIPAKAMFETPIVEMMAELIEGGGMLSDIEFDESDVLTESEMELTI